MIDLIIASRALAGKILNNSNRVVDYLVSIGDPSRDPPSGFYYVRKERKLRLEFWDIQYDTKQPNIPSVADIQAIVEFTRSVIKPVVEQQPIVLVHCEAGISRSAATAQIILEELGLTEQEAIAEVMRVRPQAIPNQYLLQLYRATI